MGKRIDDKVLKYVAVIIEGSGAKPKDKIKLGILAHKFYTDNKTVFDLDKVPFTSRKIMMSNFLLFTIQFESVCLRAYRPISGSQSTADDLIDLYQKKGMQNIVSKKENPLLKQYNYEKRSRDKV